MPNDSHCDNGQFCDGVETCDIALDCQAGSDPCAGGSCNETTDICEGPTVHVASVLTGTANAGRGFKHGTATVTLADSNGNPVGADFNVIGNFGGTFIEEAFDLTDGGGVAFMQTTADPQKSVTVTFCVSDVDGTFADPSLTYAPEDNAPGTTCGLPPVCDDGEIESPEVCDGANLGGEDCVSLGFTGGTLACDSSCLAFDTSSCTGDQCIATHSKEKGPRCSDGFDNDCDGDIDELDSDCQ